MAQPMIHKQLTAIVKVCNRMIEKGTSVEYFRTLKAECEFGILQLECEQVTDDFSGNFEDMAVDLETNGTTDEVSDDQEEAA